MLSSLKSVRAECGCTFVDVSQITYIFDPVCNFQAFAKTFALRNLQANLSLEFKLIIQWRIFTWFILPWLNRFKCMRDRDWTHFTLIVWTQARKWRKVRTSDDCSGLDTHSRKYKVEPNELFIPLDQAVKKSTVSEGLLDLTIFESLARQAHKSPPPPSNSLKMQTLYWMGWDGWTKWLFQLQCTLRGMLVTS